MTWVPKTQIAVATDPSTAALISTPTLTQKAVDGRVQDVAEDIIAGDPTIKAAASTAINEAIDSGGLDSRWYPQFVRAENLVTNGRFLAGSSGWSVYGSAITTANGVATATGTGALGQVGLYSAVGNRFTAAAGHIMFYRARVRARAADAAALRLWMSDASTTLPLNGVSNNVASPAQDVWYDIYGTITIPQSWDGKTIQSYVAAAYASAAAANGKVTEVSRITVLDLTRMYGAGKEPPAGEIEALVKLLPSEYVDQVVPAFERNRQIVTRDDLPSIVQGKTFRRGSGSFVIFRFDDGFVSNLELAAPYMAQKGMVGYVGMCTRLSDTVRPGGRIMKPAEVLQLMSMGWEVGSHTTHHNDAIADPAAFVTSLDNSIADLVSWGVPYPDTFTYPNGSRTAGSDKEVYRRFAKAQLTGYPQLTLARCDEPTFFTGWTVIVGNAPSSTREAQFERLKAYVRESFRQGRVATLGFHSITTGLPAEDYNLDFAMFTRIVDWVHAEGYPVGLPRDMRPFNQLADPGFNEYPIRRYLSGTAYPWAYDIDGGWERVQVGQSTGLAAARLIASSASNARLHQETSLDPGDYKVHVLMSVPARSSGAIRVSVEPLTMFGTSAGPAQMVFERTATTTGYIDVTGTFTMPKAAPIARLLIEGIDWVGDALVDHVSIASADLYDPLA